ncbi:MAG: J domain-containing protein [Spirochaetaceae bacterium]
MTVQAAYRILALSPDATTQDLVRAYRRLVKRYHPDYNAERQAWSTDRMTEVNLAYETVRSYFRAQSDRAAASHEAAPPSSGAGRHARETRSSAFRVDPSAGTAETARPRPTDPDVSPQFTRLFCKPWQFVLDGVYLFYLYGLENVHLRHQGVHRFRYRQATKCLKDGIAGLDPLAEDTVTSADETRLTTAQGFSKAFLQNMLLEKYYIPTRVPTELKAYNHYHEGSRRLDDAIRRRFCRDVVERHRLSSDRPGNLEVVQHELMTVIAKYTESSWVTESLIKMHLLDRFNAAVKAKLPS